MTPSDLRYQASREWMEAEIHAGRPVQHRRQSLSVDPSALDPELAIRVEAIIDGVLVKPDSKRVTVLDSGVDPESRYGPSDKELVPMDEPIVQAIGELPELPEPTEDLEAVVIAWEEWLRRYCDEALKVIDRLNVDQPKVGKGPKPRERTIGWDAVRIYLGPGLETSVGPDDGPKAMCAARAAWEWSRAARERFSIQSVMAAQEATAPVQEESQQWMETLGAEEIAECFLERVKRMYAAAKAHDAARRAQVPDFDVEMARWASEHGSDRLQLGVEDGYRMNARYLTERLAKEAPGFYAMPINAVKDGWARRTGSPSEEALRLRRRVEAVIHRSAPANFDGPPIIEIVTVVEPPPQIYLAHVEGSGFGDDTRVTDLPSKDGWPWFYDEDGEAFGYDAKPFEAVVVQRWLGRFHLIGAVAGSSGIGPAGIWAVPEAQHFHEDGSVDSQDPDAPTSKAAKRKPPNPGGGDDDIPF